MGLQIVIVSVADYNAIWIYKFGILVTKQWNGGGSYIKQFDIRLKPINERFRL